MFNVDLSNGSVLAYVGDAVMTLKVREYLVNQGITKAKELQEKSAEYISAKAQALIVCALLERGFLSEREQEIFHLGRNYKGHSRAKNVTVGTYKLASGFEALWGYLYLDNNPQRLEQIWDETRTIVENELC
jgi:ribonuclease-3 family protein